MSAFWLAGAIFTLALLEDELKWWQCALIVATWPLHLGYWVKKRTK